MKNWLQQVHDIMGTASSLPSPQQLQLHASQIKRHLCQSVEYEYLAIVLCFFDLAFNYQLSTEA